MLLYRTSSGSFIQNAGSWHAVPLTDWDSLFDSPNLAIYLAQIAATTPAVSAPAPESILAPIVSQEVWAAGVTYFAFLALFPVLLLVASVIGLVLARDALLQQELFHTIRETFPGSVGRQLVRQLTDAVDGAGFIGLIALAGFLYAGLRTVD